jgi:hypothetical protein
VQGEEGDRLWICAEGDVLAIQVRLVLQIHIWEKTLADMYDMIV